MCRVWKPNGWYKTPIEHVISNGRELWRNNDLYLCIFICTICLCRRPRFFTWSHYGYWVLSLPASVFMYLCVCVRPSFLLVRTITQEPFKLESQWCWMTSLRTLLFLWCWLTLTIKVKFYLKALRMILHRFISIPPINIYQKILNHGQITS